MLGGKYRDRLRCYCDTPDSNDPKMFGERMKERIAKGFTWLKMDIGINAHLRNIAGTISGNPAGMVNDVRKDHTMLGVEITQKGAEVMADYITKVREVVGWEIPISADHFGQMGLNSIIRLGKAFEKCNLAWMEDVLPWYETDMLKKVSDAIDVPICTGEDMYLMEPFENLCRNHVVEVIHPDLSTSGGILETKRIGDMAQKHGIAWWTASRSLSSIRATSGFRKARASASPSTKRPSSSILLTRTTSIPHWSGTTSGPATKSGRISGVPAPQ